MIGGIESSTWWMVWKVVVTVWLIVLTILMVWPTEWMKSHYSSFSNPNDTQYANRFQAGPDGESLNDRMVAAQAKGVAAWQASQGKVSTLTGSRDVPVFFQDYDIDMQQKGGNIYNQREGFGEPTDCGIPGAC
jgi:hypothetical protein